MFWNKKGMEVAIGTLVGMILGALMLFAGIGLLATIMLRTEDVRVNIDQQMIETIIQAFDSNDPLYIHRNPLSPRKSEDVVFGIGIYNFYNEPRTFSVNVTYNRTLFDSDEFNVAVYPPEPVLIGAKQKSAAFVIVPTKKLPRGQHNIVLNVSVKNASDDYNLHDTLKPLYVHK